MIFYFHFGFPFLLPFYHKYTNIWNNFVIDNVSESLPQLLAILHKQVLQVCDWARSRAAQTCTKVSIMVEMVMTKIVRDIMMELVISKSKIDLHTCRARSRAGQTCAEVSVIMMEMLIKRARRACAKVSVSWDLFTYRAILCSQERVKAKVLSNQDEPWRSSRTSLDWSCLLSLCRLRLDDQDASSLEGEGEEENFLTKRQTEAVLGWEEETLLSERQLVEEEEVKNKETAFLVTRTDRQTMAFVVVGLIASSRNSAKCHHCEPNWNAFFGRLISPYHPGWDNPDCDSVSRPRHGWQTNLLLLQVVAT